MRVRLAVTCSLVLSLAATVTPALAGKPRPAPKPVCNLLVDDKDDGYATTGGAVLRSPAMDIHGADIATGKKTVVGVLRLQKADTSMDPVAWLGMTWNLNFKVRGNSYSFERERPFGKNERFEYNAPGPAAPKVKETVTRTHLEVRFEIQRSAIPELKKPKAVIENIAVSGTVFFTNGDAGSTQRDYADLTPSCLRPA